MPDFKHFRFIKMEKSQQAYHPLIVKTLPMEKGRIYQVPPQMADTLINIGAANPVEEEEGSFAYWRLHRSGTTLTGGEEFTWEKIGSIE